MTGSKELLGLWIGEVEGAKFWLNVLTELSNRGVRDILIASVDGLTGFPEAIGSVFAKTEVQLCMVHMVRNSLRYVPWKHRQGRRVEDLRQIYTAPTVEAATQAPDAFEAGLGRAVPDGGQDLAHALGQHHPVLRLPRADPQGDLHDQRGGITECPTASGNQETRGVPD